MRCINLHFIQIKKIPAANSPSSSLKSKCELFVFSYARAKPFQYYNLFCIKKSFFIRQILFAWHLQLNSPAHMGPYQTVGMVDKNWLSQLFNFCYYGNQTQMSPHTDTSHNIRFDSNWQTILIQFSSIVVIMFLYMMLDAAGLKKRHKIGPLPSPMACASRWQWYIIN